jgi:acyl carrier protein
VDSLGLLKVVAWLEDEFDIGVDDSELGPDSFRTVAAIKAYVDQAQAGAHAE